MGNEVDDPKREAALDILLKVGVLQRCGEPDHDHVAYEHHGAELMEEAYREGNRRWAQGLFSWIFVSRREMTDALKALSEDPDYCTDECGEYARERHEDD